MIVAYTSKAQAMHGGSGYGGKMTFHTKDCGILLAHTKGPLVEWRLIALAGPGAHARESLGSLCSVCCCDLPRPILVMDARITDWSVEPSVSPDGQDVSSA